METEVETRVETNPRFGNRIGNALRGNWKHAVSGLFPLHLLARQTDRAFRKQRNAFARTPPHTPQGAREAEGLRVRGWVCARERVSGFQRRTVPSGRMGTETAAGTVALWRTLCFRCPVFFRPCRVVAGGGADQAPNSRTCLPAGRENATRRNLVPVCVRTRLSATGRHRQATGTRPLGK